MITKLKESAAHFIIKLVPYPACPRCGTVLREQQKYCAECGRKIIWSTRRTDAEV